MSISLITDGMLYPIITIEGLHAPDGTEGHMAARPVPPCKEEALLTDGPPITPRIPLAAGPRVPTTPCGIMGSDPTIDPPRVPTGSEASETVSQEAPAIPTCPQGRKT